MGSSVTSTMVSLGGFHGHGALRPRNHAPVHWFCAVPCYAATEPCSTNNTCMCWSLVPCTAPTTTKLAVVCVHTQIGPKGLEFAKYSIDYHYVRNWLYVNRCVPVACLSAGECWRWKICSTLLSSSCCSSTWTPLLFQAPFCLNLGHDPASLIEATMLLNTHPLWEKNRRANFTTVCRHWGKQRADAHIPSFAKR